jgi:hypothetical protein
MEKDKHKTLVIFRKWKSDGSIIAIFPFEAWSSAYDCASYMHIGQHGGCNPSLPSRADLTCKPSLLETVPLYNELERMGYKLKQGQRVPRNALEKRRASIKA